jgi:drug/metabolite transporter (DMT)-like permease
MMDKYSKGVLQVSAGAILWGLGYPLWRLIAMQVSPLLLTSLTFSIAALCMPFLYSLKLDTILRDFRENFFLLILLGLSGGVLGTVLLLFALSRMDSGVTSLLEKLQPVFALIAARMFLGESLPRKSFAYMLAALACSYLIALPDPLGLSVPTSQILAALAAVGSAFFYGVNTVICKFFVDKEIAPRYLLFYRMSLGALFSLLACPLFQVEIASELASVDAYHWVLIVVATAISLLIAFDLFLSGLRHVPASLATFLELLTPLFALSTGAMFLDETLSLTQCGAIPFFVFAIVSLTRISRAHTAK